MEFLDQGCIQDVGNSIIEIETVGRCKAAGVPKLGTDIVGWKLSVHTSASPTEWLCSVLTNWLSDVELLL